MYCIIYVFFYCIKKMIVNNLKSIMLLGFLKNKVKFKCIIIYIRFSFVKYEVINFLFFKKNRLRYLNKLSKCKLKLSFIYMFIEFCYFELNGSRKYLEKIVIFVNLRYINGLNCKRSSDILCIFIYLL